MAYSTVTSKGQVTIPKAVRDRMGIEEGSRLVFVDDGDRILVYKVEADLAGLYGAVKHEGPPIDFTALKREVGKAIAERFLAESKDIGTESMDQKGQQIVRKDEVVAARKKSKGTLKNAKASGIKGAASPERTGGKPKVM